MRPWRPLTVRAPNGGFIVVAALWILAALAALASIFAIYAANTALAVAVNDENLEAEALVRASLELTAYRLPPTARDHRPTRGEFSYRLGRANVHVEFCSEAARIDLNMAPKDLLARLFAVLGASSMDAAQYADRIIGWRTAPDSGTLDKEASLYSAAGLSYTPRGAPFASVDELPLVLGLPPALVEAAMPYVTVYSGRPEINARDAAPVVLAALPGMTPARLFSALGEGPFSAQQSAGASAGAAQGKVTTEGSRAMRVAVTIAFDQGRKIVSQVVILLDGKNEPYHVLWWQDDIDAQAPVMARGGAR